MTAKCRHIIKYKFINTAPDSPYMSRRFEKKSKKYLNGILWGNLKLGDMIEECKDLHKHEK